jgi:hypothetical protein
MILLLTLFTTTCHAEPHTLRMGGGRERDPEMEVGARGARDERTCRSEIRPEALNDPSIPRQTLIETCGYHLASSAVGVLSFRLAR